MSLAFPDGIASGDVTQTSAVLWTRVLSLGDSTFVVETDADFTSTVATEQITVTDDAVPVKVRVTNLGPNQQCFYRAIDADLNTNPSPKTSSEHSSTITKFPMGLLRRLVDGYITFNVTGTDGDLII